MTVLGAQYYRPPNPPREDWRRDLERMKDAGLNTVKFWACWSWINQSEHEFDLADLQELIDYAGEIGLDVVVNTIIENAPYWLEERAPFARYRDHEGRDIHLTAAMNTPGGGWPGLCFDNEEVRTAAARFLESLVKRFDRHPALTVWDVWNEPHVEPASYYPERIYCYCDASVGRFVAWLREKYGDIRHLNDAWSRRYSSWSQVEPPRAFEAVPDMLDWREFWVANLRSWLSWRVETVRTAGATVPVMTHVALSGFTGQLATHSLDEFTLTDDVDAFGTSSFPTWLMADDHVEHLFNLDTARDAARGKPFWQAELQGGRGRRDGLASTGQPAPEVVALWMWNSLAAGATGVMFWQWRPELLGPESPGYGLCAPDGSLTERVTAVSRFSRVAALPQLRDRVTDLPTLALLVSRRTALHAYATDRTMALYRDAVMGAYRLLTDRDVAVTVLHEDDVERDGVPPRIRTIYWPMPSVASTELVAGMVAFVDAGGRLVAEAGPGEYADTGHRRTDVPAGELARVFGRSQVETTTPSEDECIDLDGAHVNVAWQIESSRLDGAQVVGTFRDGSPAVTVNSYGEGTGVLISSYPSLAYNKDADAETATSVVALLGGSSESSPSVWMTPAPGLVSRRARTADGRGLIFAINWSDEPAALANIDNAEILASTSVGASAMDEVPGKSAVLIVSSA
jgi:beta-galactosidase GanA